MLRSLSAVIFEAAENKKTKAGHGLVVVAIGWVWTVTQVYSAAKRELAEGQTDDSSDKAGRVMLPDVIVYIIVPKDDHRCNTYWFTAGRASLIFNSNQQRRILPCVVARLGYSSVNCHIPEDSKRQREPHSQSANAIDGFQSYRLNYRLGLCLNE